jgi:hypothetical protein
MTIGDYVESRALALRTTAIASAVVMTVLVFIIYPERFVDAENTQIAMVAAPVVALSWIVAATSRCPRCEASLGKAIRAVAAPFSTTVPDHCENCDVSFDEPMENPKNGKLS